MDTDPIPIDAEELARVTDALRATSYHGHLERYVRDRIAYLLDKELTDPHAITKCRGQVEELQHLLRPALCQTLACDVGRVGPPLARRRWRLDRLRVLTVALGSRPEPEESERLAEC